MTYSWKEGAVKRKAIQIGQEDAKAVSGSNKRHKPKKKDKHWYVECTYQWATQSDLNPTFVRQFLHEEDARKFATKQSSSTVHTRVWNAQETQ